MGASEAPPSIGNKRPYKRKSKEVAEAPKKTVSRAKPKEKPAPRPQQPPSLTDEQRMEVWSKRAHKECQTCGGKGWTRTTVYVEGGKTEVHAPQQCEMCRVLRGE